MNRVFLFKTKNRANPNERPFLLAIPEDKIEQIESQAGSEAVYCKVNGIEVDCDFNELLKEFNVVRS
jgi:hypothetical protein